MKTRTIERDVLQELPRNEFGMLDAFGVVPGSELQLRQDGEMGSALQVFHLRGDVHTVEYWGSSDPFAEASAIAPERGIYRHFYRAFNPHYIGYMVIDFVNQYPPK